MQKKSYFMTKKSHNLWAWLPHLFLFYKERVFRKLTPVMFVLVIYAAIIAISFKGRGGYSLGQFHLIFSFILAIIIGFRVNTSYSRWWEGRTLWGSIVNNSRNLALKFETYVGLNQYPEFANLLGKLPIALKAKLRDDEQLLEETMKSLGITEYDPKQPIVLIAQRMYGIVHQLRNETRTRVEQCSHLDNHIANLIDMVGGCERIAKTRVPPAYAFFVKQALLFYSLMFPFGWIHSFGILIIPMMVMIVYILLGLEILSEELEDPFRICDNGLNLGAITRTIESNIAQIAGNKR